MKRIIRSIVFILSIAVLSPVVSAHESQTHYDRIHLSANASAQVDNDTMVVTVYAEEEGSDVSVVSNIVNKRISHGLELVKRYPQIKHQTNAYTTSPVYVKNKIKGWRVRQSLRLESRDMAIMSDVLGRLQGGLALQSMQFSVSPESIDAQDTKLIDEALGAFESRAKQVATKLGRKGYKIVDINISTSGNRAGRPQYMMRAMAMDSVETAPAVSAGEQTVSVSVSGNIELE